MLYLLSGTIGGPISLYKITANEGPELVRTVAESSDFVLGDSERRRLIIGWPWAAPSTFSIINMDKPEDERTARIAYDSREVLPAYNEYLLELPDKRWGIALWLNRVRKAPSQWSQTLRAVFPDAKPDAVDVPLDALSYVRFGGVPGLGGTNGSLDAPWVRGVPPGILLAGEQAGNLGAAAAAIFTEGS